MTQQARKTILIIEDEKSLRGALVDILMLKKYIPLKARNGREGLELALSNHPDLILLDLIMPEMDGLTTLKKIREEDAWGKKVPIIILTNLSESKDLSTNDSVTSQSTYYLIKSDWKLHDVVHKIESVLGK